MVPQHITLLRLIYYLPLHHDYCKIYSKTLKKIIAKQQIYMVMKIIKYLQTQENHTCTY